MAVARDESPAIDEKNVESRISALEKDESEDSLTAIAIYREVLALMKDARAAAMAEDEFRRKSEGIPAALKELSARNSEQQGEDQLPPSVDGSLDDMVRQSEIVKAELAGAQAAVQSHLKEGKARLDRQAALPELIARTSADLAALPDPGPVPASAEEPVLARNLLARTRRELLQRQMRSLEAELEYSESSPALFSAESGMLARRVTMLGKRADQLAERVDQMRLAAGNDEIARAREDLKRFADDPAEKRVAAENLELAERHGGSDGLGEKMASATNTLSNLNATMDRVSKQFASARRRVQLLEEVKIGIESSTGRLLRSQRQSLPPERDLRSSLRDTVRQSAQAQIDLLALEDRQAGLLAMPLPSAAEKPELHRLWKTRQANLRLLIEDHQSYIRMLGSITTLIRSLIEESSEFALFVDQRLLWIPSTEPIGRDELAAESAAIAKLFAGDPFSPLRRNAVRHSWLWGLTALLWIYLVARRRSFRSRLKKHGEEAVKRNCTSYLPTGMALLYSVLIAAPVPLAMWFLFSQAQECTIGVLHGIRNVSAFLTGAILLQVIARSSGLMVDHFRIEEGRCKVLRRPLGWLIPTMPPFLFLSVALPLESEASNAGRLSFIAVLIILLVFSVQLLLPSKGLIQWRGKTSSRLAKSCFALALVMSIGLMIGAAIGYFDSAQEMRLQMMMSIGLVLETLLVAAILYRWILVSRRRFAVQQALKRRAAALAEREGKEAEPGTKPQNEASLEEVKANALKVVEVGEQTNRLVRTASIAVILFGLWGIWRTAVPALSALDRVSLWEERLPAAEPPAAKSPASALTKPLEDVSSSPASKKDEAAVRTEAVTLQDLVSAVILLVLTFVAARNIPGLLELLVFRHMHLQPGSSFAFTTTIRYLIVVVGMVAAFANIGITWGKVQWIAAAVTLGIGFGLQEIFANFVAGLIILFERPIRLGDVVTIAGIDGKVTQIRIRATTIRQFNSRELIVPNKEFITGQLVNWTLSDNVLRVEVPVGIAYGSDTELARDLLLKAARENRRVLEEPGPVAVFDNFADSSLAFILRAHVGSIDDLVPARDELHFAIDKSFREAGIEIAFPQSDIHIRSMPEAVKED